MTSGAILVALDVAPDRNGVATYWGDLAQLLERRGVSMRLLCAAREAHAPRFVSPKTLFHLPLLGDHTQAISFPSPYSVTALIHALEPSLIVVPTPGPIGLLAARAAQRELVPCIACVHTDFSALVPGLFSPAVRWMLARPLAALETFVVRRAAVVAAPAGAHARRVAERFGVTVHEVASPLSPEFSDVPPAKPPSAVRRVLFAGRLSAEKNLGALLDAARVHYDLEFMVVGDGPARQRLQRTASANVRFQPWQTRRDLRGFLDDCDVVVLPSTVESFGIAALEAMARQRVVISSAASGISGVLRDGDNGCMLSGDVALHERLGDVRRLPACELGAIGLRARQTALEYSERCVSEWHQLVSAHSRD